MSAALLNDRSRNSVFANDWRDALLVVVSLIELVGKIAMVIFWNAMSGPIVLVAVVALCLLNCTNFMCVAHYFLHLPFFSRRWLNRVWGVVGSLSLGQPITLYRAHHLNHHRYGMDYVDDKIGDTRDWSSIYRYGHTPSRPEALWRYAALAPLRESPFPLIADVRSRGEIRQLIAETVCLALFVVLLAFIDWHGFILVYLPVWYFGQVLARAEAYSEHLGATPGDRRTDSVSCYGRLYNLLWFNNGFHQEHHFRPGAHWTELPTLRDQMLPETDRHVVPIAHFMNAATRLVRPERTKRGDRAPAALS
jgi:fatty acid desaturase